MHLLVGLLVSFQIPRSRQGSGWGFASDSLAGLFLFRMSEAEITMFGLDEAVLVPDVVASRQNNSRKASSGTDDSEKRGARPSLSR